MSSIETIEEFERRAVRWWPDEIQQSIAEESVLPRLLETQDKFLHIVSLADKSPEQIFGIIEAAQFPANLFVKHLSVLSDFGGESIQRLSRDFDRIFPRLGGADSKHYMQYTWMGKTHQYVFANLPSKPLSNKNLKIDGKGLLEAHTLNDMFRDVIMIFLFGASTPYSEHASLSSCGIGSVLGSPTELENFVKQRYLFVSRITRGAATNMAGQLAQKRLVCYLTDFLGPSFSVKSNGQIDIGEDVEARLSSFDVVVCKGNKNVGIEVSFQVTTNSVIERKSAQAKERQTLMHRRGDLIAYVIDGAGNLQRTAAINRILEHSDYTCAYSESDFQGLVKWIRSNL